MIPVAVVAAVVLSATCPQPVDRPDCITVPRHEAVTALKCIDADLPQCEANRDIDRQTAEAIQLDLAEQLVAERKRVDALDALLVECSKLEPPAQAWYERPWVVATVSVVATVAVVAAVR